MDPSCSVRAVVRLFWCFSAAFLIGHWREKLSFLPFKQCTYSRCWLLFQETEGQVGILNVVAWRRLLTCCPRPHRRWYKHLPHLLNVKATFVHSICIPNKCVEEVGTYIVLSSTYHFHCVKFPIRFKRSFIKIFQTSKSRYVFKSFMGLEVRKGLRVNS